MHWYPATDGVEQVELTKPVSAMPWQAYRPIGSSCLGVANPDAHSPAGVLVSRSKSA
jgi:hypothetical protein